MNKCAIWVVPKTAPRNIIGSCSHGRTFNCYTCKGTYKAAQASRDAFFALFEATGAFSDNRFTE